MWPMVLVVLTTLPVLLTTIVFIYFKRSYNHWARANIPFLPPVLPFGNVRSIILRQENACDVFAGIYKELKPKSDLVGGFYFLARPELIIFDPDLIKAILKKDFESFHDRDLFMDEEVDPLSAHLVVLRGAKWRNMRTKLTPTFSSAKIKAMFCTIADCSTKNLLGVVRTLADRHEAIDIKSTMGRLTTDTIMSCIFGVECNCLVEPDNKFREYGEKIFAFGWREVVVNILHSTCPRLLRWCRITATKPDVVKFFMDTLRNVVEYREKNGIHRTDFLDLFIRLKNNQSVADDEDASPHGSSEKGFSFNELAAQAYAFFAAGFETTSSTLCYGLLELAVNQDIQDKLRKEILDILQDHGGEISYDAVMAMKYMDKVVSEVLRKYPSIPILGRVCTKDYNIPGMNFMIREGTRIAICAYGLHYDAKYYPEPEKFDPERFSEESKMERHPSVYLPFGDGPRICIGMRFALIQVKLVLAVLLKNFKFSLDAKTVLPIRFDPNSTFLGAKDPIWLQARTLDI